MPTGFPWKGPQCSSIGIGCFKRFEYMTVPQNVHSKFSEKFTERGCPYFCGSAQQRQKTDRKTAEKETGTRRMAGDLPERRRSGVVRPDSFALFFRLGPFAMLVNEIHQAFNGVGSSD